jgi:hypothetical protein
VRTARLLTPIFAKPEVPGWQNALDAFEHPAITLQLQTVCRECLPDLFYFNWLVIPITKVRVSSDTNEVINFSNQCHRVAEPNRKGGVLD